MKTTIQVIIIIILLGVISTMGVYIYNELEDKKRIYVQSTKVNQQPTVEKEARSEVKKPEKPEKSEKPAEATATAKVKVEKPAADVQLPIDVKKKKASDKTASENPLWISNDQIREAIKAGKRYDYRDRFKLPVVEDQIDGEIYEAYISTPYYRAAQKSYIEYYHKDRTITVAEVRKNVRMDRIILEIHFRHNAKFYAVNLFQDGNEVEISDVGNSPSENNFKLVYIDPEAFIFDDPMLVKVFAKDDPSQYKTFELILSDYLK
ncbi:hypothetical protein [Paenibacillus sp. 481]|uniref:hypothetical protein n=1 Tax=Paenibacillus sp. 481 TaxID=2835869 RepID=UPI001E396234|nr:hypothetical protein [Paenibacillus sp. 481]UHA74564.1 hypothetical protein KIK04_05565 [Paenibacillus sp. 481]